MYVILWNNMKRLLYISHKFYLQHQSLKSSSIASFTFVTLIDVYISICSMSKSLELQCWAWFIQLLVHSYRSYVAKNKYNRKGNVNENVNVFTDQLIKYKADVDTISKKQYCIKTCYFSCNWHVTLFLVLCI